ncbi:MAG: TetR family transcriptional regulator [Clostridium perfringens]|nr:TetR family transcriptional regulator [Clostridium perfringens]
MEFKRARNAEQKDQRIDQILKVTEELFSQHNYGEITLAMIAKKLDYTRGNLYKYVSTKEEIFLKMYDRKQEAWINEVLSSFSNKENISKEHFSDIWSKVLSEHQEMLKLHGILGTIIEANVSVEKLAEFKKKALTDLYKLIPIIQKQFPKLDDSECRNFLFTQLFYATGLYNNVNFSPLQIEALKLSSMPYEEQNFYDTFHHFMKIFINGYSSIE